MATEDEEPREAVENRGRPVGLNPGVSGITLNQGAPRGQAQAEGELPAESCWCGRRRTFGRRRLQGGTGSHGPERVPDVRVTVGGAEVDGSEKTGTQICTQRPQLSRSSSCGGDRDSAAPANRASPASTERHRATEHVPWSHRGLILGHDQHEGAPGAPSGPRFHLAQVVTPGSALSVQSLGSVSSCPAPQSSLTRSQIIK